MNTLLLACCRRFVFLTLLVEGARAGTWTSSPWTGDASSGISTDSKWAYHFGSSASAGIGGRSVTGIATASPSAAGNFSITGVGQVFNNDDNNLTALTGTGSATIAKDFIWGGNPGTITLHGLTPGNVYVATFLSVGFDATGGRQVTFASGGDSRVVDQNQFGDNAGLRVDYAFTADAATRVVTVSPLAATPTFTFHFYGLALRPGSFVIGTESFSYAGGVITGQTGGTGWNRRNLAPVGPGAGVSDWDTVFGAPTIVSGHLETTNAGVKREYNGPGEGLPDTTDEGLGGINSAREAKAVYYKVTVTPGVDTTHWGLSSYDFSSERVFFGMTPGQTNFGIQIGGNVYPGSVPVLPGRRYQLVTRLDHAAQRVSLYVNPDLSAPEAANTPAATVPYSAGHWSTAVGLASGGAGTVAWDSLEVATAWKDLQPVSDTTGATYVFNSSTRQITVNGGAVTSVEGTTLTGSIDLADAVEFRFNSDLYFDPADRILFHGSKPVRLGVTGNVTIPAGMTVSANPVGNVPVAGGGPAGATAPGGAAGSPAPVAALLRQMAPEDVTIFKLRAAGGAGGLVADSGIGLAGEPSYRPQGNVGVPGPPFSSGWIGLPGGNGIHNDGGQGFGSNVVSLPYSPSTNGEHGGLQPAAAGGGGGRPGDVGGLFGSGGEGQPGGNGGNGAAGRPAGPGRHGVGGPYGHVPVTAALRLVGGNGGNSGEAGGGGEGGYGGGGGGGGGQGGQGGDSISGVRGAGGAGGQGGFGCIGGFGGAGGNGGAGGAGGGAFEIRATGTIRNAGTLLSQGAGGVPGTAGEPGSGGEPMQIIVGIESEGHLGLPGATGGTFGTDGGLGGKGGNGGAGGAGGMGGTGAHGAGGAGGTIILRATTVENTGTVNVNGGAGVPGVPSGKGADGSVQFISAPGFTLSPAALNPVVARGSSLPVQTLTLFLPAPGSHLYYATNALPWWVSLSPSSGPVNGPATQNLQLTINSAVLGGGFYSFPVTISDTDALNGTPPQTVMVNVTVSGPPDDHFPEIPGATGIPAAMNVSRAGNLETGGDIDLFKIVITTPGTLELWTTGGTDTFGALLDSTGQEITSNEDAAESADRNFRLVHDVTPGTYYIRVRGYSSSDTGAYTLHVNANPVIVPPLPQFRVINDSDKIWWDSKLGTNYRILRSSDLRTWAFNPVAVFPGTGGPLGTSVDFDSHRGFYRIAENPQPLVAARVLSSGSAAGSASVTGRTTAVTMNAGVPANLGDTALLVDGLPLKQQDGLLMATAGRAGSTSLVATPGQFTATAPGGFPGDGSWLATNGLGANIETSAAPASLAWFPRIAGWLGGTFKGGSPNNDANYLLQNAGTFSFMTIEAGPPSPTFRHIIFDNVGTDPFWVVGQGVCLATGATDGASLLVTGIKPVTIDNRAPIQGYQFFTWLPDGTRFTDQAFSWVYVPYNTPGIVAGQVAANGTVTSGTGNFSIAWNAAASRYQLTIPSMPDLTQGALLLTAFDTNPNCQFIYEAPTAARLDITASRLPLGNQPAGAQCGFFFVYVPFSRLILNPGP